MLRIFREMMQRESPGARDTPLATAEPEKVAPVREKRKKKRKQYSSLHSQKSIDSSGVERIKKTAQYNVAERNKFFSGDRTQSNYPFPSEKRDSWWVWDTCSKQKGSTSCSCASCQLKKIFSSEYSCIACLIFLFMISVFIAFFLVFKTIALVPDTPEAKETNFLDSHSLKTKLDSLQKGEDLTRIQRRRGMRRSVWDDNMINNMESSYGEQESDVNFLKTNKLDKTNVRAESDLSSLLEPIRGDPHVSPRLLKFYRKLIEADAQIKHLKEGINEKQGSHEFEDHNNLFRLKRSLFHVKNHGTDKQTKVKENERFPIKIYDDKDEKEKSKNKDLMKKVTTALKDKKVHKDNHKTNFKVKKTKRKRGRRYFNDSGSDDILYEKKRVFIQYVTDKPKFPKCTHCPQDSKSHEHKMKHPFYKNSQKLEELLDQFLDKNLNDVMPDELGFKSLLDKPKNFKCQHHETTSTTTKRSTKKPTTDTTVLTTTTTTQKSTTNQNLYSLKAMTTDFYDKYLKPNLRKIMKSPIPKREDVDIAQKKVIVSNDGTIDFITETEPSYDIVLSVSTIINKQLDEDKNGYDTENIPKLPSRRLLQADDEEQEEVVGYEDFKEVLSDEMTAHDETDRQVERKRREEPKLTERPPVKNNPPGVFNQNWKGPVPLYPDEISSMIKKKEESKADPQRQDTNKQAQYIDPSKHVKYHQDGLNDVDYVEDYLSDKYERLAKMAQAYSDYGVLADKKDVLKSEKSQDKGSKESVSAASVRVKKGSENKAEEEGLAFQAKSYENEKKDDDPAKLWKILTKHLRITNDLNQKEYDGTTLVPVRPGLGIMYTPGSKCYNHFTGKKKPKLSTLKPDELFNDLVVPNRVGRSLKSVAEIDENIDVTTSRNTKEKLPMDFLNKSATVTEAKDKVPKDEDSIIKIGNKKSGNVKRTATEELEKLLSEIKETTEPSKKEEFESFPVITTQKKEKSSPRINNKVEKSLEHVTEVINAMRKSEFSSNEFDPGAFFGMISSWFNTLAAVSIDTASNNQSSDPGNPREVEKPEFDTSNTGQVNATKEILYPMYDSDMIENIGHRSRVLMSVDEDNADHKSVAEKQETVLEKSTDTLETTEPTSTLTANLTEKTKETKNQKSIQANESEKDDKLENKTLVKRNAEDGSKLVFWNEIYDDEYGIQVDPLDETVKDKAGNDIVKKSAVWIQNKMKKMSDSIKKRSKDSLSMIHKLHEDGDITGLQANEDFNKALHKISKRHNENDSDNPLDKKAGIAMLTAHMQEVCKRASQAVQQTRNKSQNQDPESEVASGLMQQLVKLMSELVDYEVHQKTCVKLPGELKDFLDWLTRPAVPSPKSQVPNIQNLKVNVPEENEPSLIPTTSSSEKEDVKLDVRSECLGTLIAVQDLIQEYSLLSEDDKSKMGGVREYLEDQLDFLHKQLNSLDEINLANIYAKSYMPYRFRREVDMKTSDNGHNKFKFDNLPNHRIKRKLGRFLKTYGKKHTRTTASNYESLQVSTDYYDKKRSDNTESGQHRQETKVDSKREVTSFDIDNTEKTKRNLKDVYYKAIADAKKITTMKNMFSKNKDYDNFDKGTNAMTSL